MDDDLILYSAKVDEARAWPEDFCIDGVSDWDASPTTTMAAYRRDFADLDQFPTFVEIICDERRATSDERRRTARGTSSCMTTKHSSSAMTG